MGWPKRKLSKLETALKGSYLVSAVLKRELGADRGIVSEQLIALIRCTSDRVFNATIWDVLVSPEYQVRPRVVPCSVQTHNAPIPRKFASLLRPPLLAPTDFLCKLSE